MDGGRLWYQRFFFRAANVQDKHCTFHIENAAGALAGHGGGHGGWVNSEHGTHPETDVGYRVRASYDKERWFAVPDTTYAKLSDEVGTLTFELTPCTARSISPTLHHTASSATARGLIARCQAH